MSRAAILLGAGILAFVNLTSFGQTKGTDSGTASKGDVSFSAEVFPIIKKNCLPCHAEDNFNPSELSLDSYDHLMAGGKHGESVLPGKSGESPLVTKLGPEPPFGDRMPFDRKRKKGLKSTKVLDEKEIHLIATWIDQGAKDN